MRSFSRCLNFSTHYAKANQQSLKSGNSPYKIAVMSMNKADKKIPEKISKAVPVDDSSVRALKKGGKSTKAK